MMSLCILATDDHTGGKTCGIQSISSDTYNTSTEDLSWLTSLPIAEPQREDLWNGEIVADA